MTSASNGKKGLDTAVRLSKSIGGEIEKGDVILEVKDLSVNFWVNNEWFTAAENVNYQLKAGEVLAIVGESGSGKTQSSMSLIGLLPTNGRATGSAKLKGTELIGMSAAALRQVRGNEISVIFQEPMTRSTPSTRSGSRSWKLCGPTSSCPQRGQGPALELMELVEIPNPEDSYSKFPHQLGWAAAADHDRPGARLRPEAVDRRRADHRARRHRAGGDPEADAELRERVSAGIILITHDMGVVADMADRIIVMKDGRVVEHGTSHQIFNDPKHPYTKQLLAAVPHLGGTVTEESMTGEPRTRIMVGDEPIPLTDGKGEHPALLLDDVDIVYPKQGRRPAFRAAQNINLRVDPGEVVGLVGESGSGKTTIGRAAVALLPVAKGRIVVDGRDITHAKQSDLLPFRKSVGIVFQDPGSSLNPRLPVGESIGEPLFLHEKLRGAELSKRVEDLLDSVELPRSMRNRYPHELSGGQRQRIGIARSLALNPRLLIADEPTSALDVSVQARVLDLFQELQERYGFACLFISHDLAVVEILSSRIAVMHHGKLVEVGDTTDIVTRPQHPYTQRLLAAVPVPDPDEQRERRELRDAIIEREHLVS